MPYVKEKDRKELDAGRPARSKGELNYLVTQAAIRYIDMLSNAYGQKVGYGLISDAISALRDAADEMARRLLAPYEDRKMGEEGDVYPDWLLARVFKEPEHPGYIEDKLRYTTGVDDQCHYKPQGG